MNKRYFSKKVVEWYQEHHRVLPWRNTQDAYKIWLSEIILQQTRVAQGLPYYEKFIQNYPDVKSLAEAKEREVLRLWQGLGYYTRARNLHKCARKVVKDFKGIFPREVQRLRQLPGVGDYTAAAISSFAFHQPVGVVDGNVFRVLARVFGLDKDIASAEGKKLFSELANELVPHEHPGLHNQAIMEFGALHCLPQNPKCENCILQLSCVAYKNDLQDVLPVKIKSQKTSRRYFYYFLVRKGSRILMNRRSQNDIWKNLFDFPLQEEKHPKRIESILKEKSLPKRVLINEHQIKTYKHVLTHQVILTSFIEILWLSGKALPRSLSSSKAKWCSVKQIEKLPKPRLITRYLEDRGIL